MAPYSKYCEIFETLAAIPWFCSQRNGKSRETGVQNVKGKIIALKALHFFYLSILCRKNAPSFAFSIILRIEWLRVGVQGIGKALRDPRKCFSLI